MNRAQVRRQIATTLNRDERKELQAVRGSKGLSVKTRDRLQQATIEPAIERLEAEIAEANKPLALGLSARERLLARGALAFACIAALAYALRGCA